jgi:multiple sugar transport system substrate-binding protein
MVREKGVFSGEYDLFLCLTDWIPELIKMNGLTILNPYIKEDPPEGWPNLWVKSLLKLQMDKGGGIYGFPYHNGPIILMYRKDLLEDEDEKRRYWEKYHRPLEIPKTWSEFLNVAKFFTRPEENLYGTVVGAYPDGHMNVYDFLLHLWTRGGRLLDENLTPAFDGIEGIEALQFYVDLIWKYKVAPRESLDLNCHKAGQFYLDGKAAIVWQWSGFACMAEIAEYSRVVGKTGYALVPRGDGKKGQHKTINVYWVLTIPAGSNQKEAAYQFLKVAASKLGDRFTTEAGAIGTRLSTWKDEGVQKKWPFYCIMEDLHKNVESPPQISEYPLINEVLNKMVDDAVKLRKPVEVAIRDAVAEIKKFALRLNS